MSTGSRLTTLAALGLAALTTSGEARADPTKAECVEANTKAQDYRREGRLSASRAQLVACSDPKCPAMVRTDCTKRLDDLERVQPSVVFSVKSAAGADVIDVRVSMDGQKLVDRLDGTAVKVDPGAHVFTFEAAGLPQATSKVLVREGESGRRESVTLEAPPDAVPESPPPPPPELPATPPPPPPPAPEGGLGAQRAVGLVIGGVGLAGLITGGVFSLLASNAWSAAQNACGGNTTTCKNLGAGNADHDTATRDATFADVGFIGGGVLVAVGGILVLTGHGAQEQSTTGLVVAPSFDRSGGGLQALGRF